MDLAFTVVSGTNEFVTLSPFLAGVIVALLARAANPRTRWLVLAGCLLPLLSAVGDRVLPATGFFVGLENRELYLAYDLLNIGQHLLRLTSCLLILLALVTVLRQRGTGSPPVDHATRAADAE
ncbi:hypothetical protein [Microlunatus sp. GCM10028923]|uniref:hypothetical protein n=1 Tax=Microlunatus sp. GCM10028923 TaxID=3273400 RepID=UPI00361B16B9